MEVQSVPAQLVLSLWRALAPSAATKFSLFPSTADSSRPYALPLGRLLRGTLQSQHAVIEKKESLIHLLLCQRVSRVRPCILLCVSSASLQANSVKDRCGGIFAPNSDHLHLQMRTVRVLQPSPQPFLRRFSFRSFRMSPLLCTHSLLL